MEFHLCTAFHKTIAVVPIWRSLCTGSGDSTKLQGEMRNDPQPRHRHGQLPCTYNVNAIYVHLHMFLNVVLICVFFSLLFGRFPGRAIGLSQCSFAGRYVVTVCRAACEPAKLPGLHIKSQLGCFNFHGCSTRFTQKWARWGGKDLSEKLAEISVRFWSGLELQVARSKPWNGADVV